jgi:hypothetical protein
MIDKFSDAITPVLEQHHEEWDKVLCLRLNQQNPKTHTLEEKICIVGQHRIYFFIPGGKVLSFFIFLQRHTPPLSFTHFSL